MVGRTASGVLGLLPFISFPRGDLAHCSTMLLNVQDDIPQELLDKAECVVILPSDKKGAFGIGGGYGCGS